MIVRITRNIKMGVIMRSISNRAIRASMSGAALLALVAAAAPAWAEEAAADEATADDTNRPVADGREIIVLGKSYGAEVGKTVTPLKDIPNTITLLDREQIEAQNLFTLEDALTATPGITVTGVGSEDPSFVTRGFTINNFLIDGTPSQAFNFPSVVPDLFFYERMEVLRGPAGLFSGSGNPAGSINMVRKRPLDEFKATAALGYGSYENLRAELDVSAPIGEVAGVRVGAMVQDQDQFFDIAHRNRLALYGVGKLDLGENTTFTAGISYDRFKPAIQSGLPGRAGVGTAEGQLLDVPRSTYLGADWNRFRSDTYMAFADLTHRVSDRWTLRASGVYTDVKRIDIYSYIGNQAITAANQGLTNHIAYRGDTYAKTKSFDFNAVGSFPALGRDHTLILGFDYQDSKQTQYFTRLSNYARINVFNPVSPTEPPLDPRGPLPPYPVQGTPGICTPVQTPAQCVTQVWGGSTTKIEQWGMYGQLRFSPFQDFTLVGGGRLTWWENESQTILPAVLPRARYSHEAQFTPYAGLVWDITSDLNLYASYADSFTPQGPSGVRRLPSGEPFKPLTGAQYEVGTKLSLFEDKLLLTLAGYQIEQSNRLFNDPDDATIAYQIGKVRSRGVEFGAAGEITPGWKINGGYSYTKTKYLEDANPILEGIPLTPIIPKHQVKVFTNYAPETGALAGFSLGGGFTWFSETWGGTPYNPNTGAVSSVVRQKGYAVVDLRAGYEFDDRYSLSVNVNNVFDKTYYARISSTGRGNFYGSPRTVFATLRVSYP